jgi:hypothetical protein
VFSVANSPPPPLRFDHLGGFLKLLRIFIDATLRKCTFTVNRSADWATGTIGVRCKAAVA